ncbi:MULTISPECIES: DoxX family membrane protein [Myxococcus]|uniref:DoxX family membrane protein n=1 Tax=Myxococcus TaxID=32 RepID=UPI0013D8D9CA|nr:MULTISPECIES: DoxX family membrane protein [Myxococcus]NVJ21354.1 DoxX family membrane protein [Myxococcus sp. AM011]
MGTETTLNGNVTGAGQDTKSLARHLPTVARVLTGLLFFVFGLNGFLNFIPPPSEPIPEGAMAFSAALMKTGYMMSLIKGTEVLVGLLLLTNRFVPLALVLLAPVTVNIVAFHAFLAPSGMVMTFIVLALHLYLAWAYRAAYRSVLVARAVPGAK